MTCEGSNLVGSLGELILPVVFSLLTGVAGVHGCLAGGPVGGADLAMLINVLEGFNETKSFIGVATYRQIIDTRVPQDSTLINNERSSKGNGIVRGQYTIIVRDFLSKIREHWDLHWSEAALVSWLLSVLHVSEVRID